VQTGNEAGSRPWAVTLVHGIGETSPVEFVKLVTDRLTKHIPGLELNSSVEIHYPTSNSSNSSSHDVDQDTHPNYSRRGRVGSAPVEFAAAHWSDVSKVPNSLVNLVGSLMTTGLGVRHFARVSMQRQSFADRALDGTLSLMIWLLGIIYIPLALASLFFGLAGFTAFYLVEGIEPMFGRPFWSYQVPVIALLTTLACCGIAVGGYYRYRHHPHRGTRTLSVPIFTMLAVFGLILSLLPILGHPYWFDIQVLQKSLRPLLTGYAEFSGNEHIAARIKFVDYIGLHFVLAQVAQRLCLLVVITLTALAIALLLAKWLSPWSSRSEKRSLLFGVVSVISMWVIITLVMWPENLVTTVAINLYVDHAKYLEELENLRVYVFNILEFEFVQLNRGAVRPSYWFSMLWFDIAYFVLLVLLMLVFVIVGAYHAIWRLTHYNVNLEKSAAKAENSKSSTVCHPRLIVSSLYIAAILWFVLAIVSIGAFVLADTFQFDIVTHNNIVMSWLQQFPHEIAVLTASVATVVIVVLTVFILIADRIRIAVKLALDVVNHFVAPSQDFPIRKKISERLKDTIEFQLRNAESPHLVVIAHSHGTVIALDTLFGHFDHNDRKWQEGLWEKGLRDRVASLTLLTFGSPVTHIYQHYFSNLYPPFDQIEDLKRISDDEKVKWVNCYRIDDYVGTFVRGVKPGFPHNIPMMLGGHIHYWKDDVFERLFSHDSVKAVLRDLKTSEDNE